jgi:glucose-1-phosphate adenylyltransferase
LINERETPENIACISLALERHWKVAEPPLSRKEPDSPGKLAIRPLIRPIMGIRNLIICPIGPKTAENQAAIVVGSEVLHVKNLLRTCLAADHVYKMDYRKLLAFHRDHGGAATVATLCHPVAVAARQFGIVAVDASSRVTGFEEKPEHPAPLPGDKENCLASMGIYVFTTQFLIEELRRNAEQLDPGHDFGRHILPVIIGREHVYAWNYSGLGTGGGPYWRDVGTLDAYYEANMDLLADLPNLDLYEKTWPIYSFQPSFPPPKIAVADREDIHSPSATKHNIFANGTLADGWLRGTVVGFDCRIEHGAVVEDSILFDGTSVGRGAEVRRAILDKNVQVRPGALVGLDHDEDQRRGFVVSEGGITCVPKGVIVDRRL